MNCDDLGMITMLVVGDHHQGATALVGDLHHGNAP